MSWILLQQFKMPYMGVFVASVLLPSASGSVLLLALAVVWLLGFMVPCIVQVSMVFAAYITAVPLEELATVKRRTATKRALLTRIPPFILGYVVLLAATVALLGGLGDLLIGQPWYFGGLRQRRGV